MFRGWNGIQPALTLGWRRGIWIPAVQHTVRRIGAVITMNFPRLSLNLDCSYDPLTMD